MIGRLSSQSRLVSDDRGQLALVNNSLISRFNRTEEKYATPKGPVKISQDDAYSPKLAPNGREIYYYVPQTGQIRSAPVVSANDPAGTGSALIAEIKSGLKEITWSADGKEIIAKDDASHIYHNLPTKSSKRLNQNALNPVFSKNADQIAYLYYDPATGEGAISLADPQIETFKNILNTRSTDWQIDWVGPKTLSLATDNSLFDLNIETGALTKILENKNNLDVVWSPNGQRLIFSSTDAESGESGLFVWDTADQTEANLDIRAQASKCVWSVNSTNIYCFAGSSLVTAEVDQTELEPKIIFTDPGFVRAETLILSGTEDYLIFRDSQTKKLYRLNLN